MRFIFLLLVFVSTFVQAAPVTWTVNNAIFDDGATLTGQFDFNSETGVYSNVSLSTSSGTILTDPWSYDQVPVGDGTEAWLGDTDIDIPNRRTLLLQFSLALSSAGGSVDLIGSEGFPGSLEVPRNLLAGASVSAVPVPAAVWLFGSGLGILGWIRRKQTSCLS
jgi:hypothetical protein